jgi:hypothetical protein
MFKLIPSTKEQTAETTHKDTCLRTGNTLSHRIGQSLRAQPTGLRHQNRRPARNNIPVAMTLFDEFYIQSLISQDQFWGLLCGCHNNPILYLPADEIENARSLPPWTNTHIDGSSTPWIRVLLENLASLNGHRMPNLRNPRESHDV